METVTDFIFFDSKIAAYGDCSHEIKRCLLLGWKVITKLGSILKSREITLPANVHIVKAMVLPVVRNGCENWTIKKAECWRIDAFELWCWRRLESWTLESPLDCKEIKPVHLKGNQSWRSDAEAIIWPPDAGEDWKQEEKWTAVDEMVRWHHWLNGHEFEQALGDGEWQGSLVCCNPWVVKELDMIEWLNNTDMSQCYSLCPTLSFSHCVHRSHYHVWVSITVLQIG